MNKICDVYMISDSSGETVDVILRAVASQLSGVTIQDHLYPLIKTKHQIDEILLQVEENNGIILCTIANEELSDYLKQNCKRKEIVCIEVLSRIIKEMASYFQTAILRGGRQIYSDSAYFERVEAINFTLQHDDGQSLDTINRADIILVGVSRSSKSPTSVYLANRGYKVANVPFIADLELPEELVTLKHKLIIGLSIDSERLMTVRKQRMKHLCSDLRLNYVDIEEISNENLKANNFYYKSGWPVIDVTERSVEEIAALIIQHYNRYFENNERS